MTQREARAALTSESNYLPPSGVKYENIGFVTTVRKHRTAVKSSSAALHVRRAVSMSVMGNITR